MALLRQCLWELRARRQELDNAEEQFTEGKRGLSPPLLTAELRCRQAETSAQGAQPYPPRPRTC